MEDEELRTFRSILLSASRAAAAPASSSSGSGGGGSGDERASSPSISTGNNNSNNSALLSIASSPTSLLLHNTSDHSRRIEIGGLAAGARFTGQQKSKRNSYGVKVELKNVDFEQSFLCGYLSISGLTEEYPVLTTFFEGEIIGPRYSFLTRKWDADEYVVRVCECIRVVCIQLVCYVCVR